MYVGLPEDAVVPSYAGLPDDAVRTGSNPAIKPAPYVRQTENGVPVWGQENPNLYAGAMTALDLLPMIASPLKTTAIGIPVAGAINSAARTVQREISGEPTTAGDVGMDFLKGATIEGGGRAVGGLLKAITDLPAVRSGLDSAANRIIRSAGKFGTGGGLTPTEQREMADTVLKNGYLFNEDSHLSLLDKVKRNTQAVDDVYAAGTRSGDAFTAPEVLANGDFSRLLNRGESTRGVTPDYLGRVNSVINTFKKGAAGEPEQTIESVLISPDLASRTIPVTTTKTIPAKPAPYTPTELNVSKRQLYQDIGNSYKNGAVNDATESAQKTLASAIKETLDAKYPGAVPFNADSSELLALEPYFARAINRISQRDAVGLGEKIALGSLKDPVGLSDITPGKLGKLVAAVWDRPEIKSRVAQMIARGARKLPSSGGTMQAAGQVAAPTMRAAFEGALLTNNDPLGIR